MKRHIITFITLFPAPLTALAAPANRPNIPFLFDVLPTLGKLCGVSGPKSSDGIAFTDTLADPAKAGENAKPNP